MRVLHVWALFALGCGGGCGGVSTPSQPARPIATQPVSAPLSGERILEDAITLCSPEFSGRGSYQEGGRKAARFLAVEFKRIGLEVVVQPIPGGAVSVIARKGGTDPAAKALIVSAHYDHLGVDGSGAVFLGADDNASGTAVLLAIARSLAASESAHDIVFAAFGAEEDGLVGSGAYVLEPSVPLASTIAVINFDMVGRNFFEAGANTPDTAAVVGLDLVEGAPKVGRAEANRVGLTLIEAPPSLLELFRLENRTDDWWFRRVGVPAIHFSTGLHDDYHRVTDTPDKLVASQLEKIATVAAALVRFLAVVRD